MSRPYMLLGDAVRLEIKNRIDHSFEIWTKNWLNEKVTYDVGQIDTDIASLSDIEKIDVFHSSDSNCTCAIYFDGGNAEVFSNIFFGGSSGLSLKTSVVAARVVQRAFRDFAISLMSNVSGLRVTEEKVSILAEAPEFQQADGAISFQASIDSQVITIILFGNCIHNTYEELTDFEPVQALDDIEFVASETCKEEKVSLEVHLDLDITIGSLTGLEIGDVVQLDKKLDAPCDVHVLGLNDIKFRAYLGAKGKNKAISVLPK